MSDPIFIAKQAFTEFVTMPQQSAQAIGGAIALSYFGADDATLLQTTLASTIAALPPGAVQLVALLKAQAAAPATFPTGPAVTAAQASQALAQLAALPSQVRAPVLGAIVFADLASNAPALVQQLLTDAIGRIGAQAPTLAAVLQLRLSNAAAGAQTGAGASSQALIVPPFRPHARMPAKPSVGSVHFGTMGGALPPGGPLPGVVAAAQAATTDISQVPWPLAYTAYQGGNVAQMLSWADFLAGKGYAGAAQQLFTQAGTIGWTPTLSDHPSQMTIEQMPPSGSYGVLGTDQSNALNFELLHIVWSNLKTQMTPQDAVAAQPYLPQLQQFGFAVAAAEMAAAINQVLAGS
jgi:hypothetical protein